MLYVILFDVRYFIVLYCILLYCIVLSCIVANCHRIYTHLQLIIIIIIIIIIITTFILMNTHLLFCRVMTLQYDGWVPVIRMNTLSSSTGQQPSHLLHNL